MVVLTKMLVVENSGVSAFKVLPQSAKQGILYKKKLDLDRVAELAPREKKLYNMIRTRQSALCKQEVQGKEAEGGLSVGQ